MTDELKARLKELGLTDEQIDALQKEGAANDSDIAKLTVDEIKSITGCGLVTAKNIVADFAPPPDTSASAAAYGAVASLDVLPAVPTDENWLQALKVGGVLKFNPETVIGTVSAALASKVGLYGLPKVLSEEMEKHATSLDEPVPAEFYSLQRALTERSYAEIFAAIPGASGRYATEPKRRELVSKIETRLWPALTGFHEQLDGWVKSWQSNPALMMGAMAALASGGPMPPGMMAPPPTDQLRDAAEGVITAINSIFAGTGTVVAMALAYDAQQIRKVLEEPSLPAQVGAANREQMLKKLGVGVTSDYPRLEANLKRYVLGVIELPNVTAGQTEHAYITALYQLGMAIPWSRLGSGELSGIGGRL